MMKSSMHKKIIFYVYILMVSLVVSCGKDKGSESPATVTATQESDEQQSLKEVLNVSYGGFFDEMSGQVVMPVEILSLGAKEQMEKVFYFPSNSKLIFFMANEFPEESTLDEGIEVLRASDGSKISPITVLKGDRKELRLGFLPDQVSSEESLSITFLGAMFGIQGTKVPGNQTFVFSVREPRAIHAVTSGSLVAGSKSAFEFESDDLGISQDKEFVVISSRGEIIEGSLISSKEGRIKFHLLPGDFPGMANIFIVSHDGAHYASVNISIDAPIINDGGGTGTGGGTDTGGGTGTGDGGGTGTGTGTGGGTDTGGGTSTGGGTGTGVATITSCADIPKLPQPGFDLHYYKDIECSQDQENAFIVAKDIVPSPDCPNRFSHLKDAVAQLTTYLPAHNLIDTKPHLLEDFVIEIQDNSQYDFTSAVYIPLINHWQDNTLNKRLIIRARDGFIPILKQAHGQAVIFAMAHYVSHVTIHGLKFLGGWPNTYDNEYEMIGPSENDLDIVIQNNHFKNVRIPIRTHDAGEKWNQKIAIEWEKPVIVVQNNCFDTFRTAFLQGNYDQGLRLIKNNVFMNGMHLINLGFTKNNQKISYIIENNVALSSLPLINGVDVKGRFILDSRTYYTSKDTEHITEVSNLLNILKLHMRSQGNVIHLRADKDQVAEFTAGIPPVTFDPDQWKQDLNFDTEGEFVLE